LHTAAEQGKLEVVLWYLEHGENVNSRNGDHRTPLILATIKRKP
jgi:ankyrin repeat protein